MFRRGEVFGLGVFHFGLPVLGLCNDSVKSPDWIVYNEGVTVNNKLESVWNEMVVA
jgi:hypothetical protein